MQQQEQKKGHTMHILAAIISGWALTIYVWMRKDIGKNHVGINALFGIGWIMLWVAYTHASDLAWLIPAFIAGWVIHRMGHAKPRNIHTHYGGTPIIAMTLFRIRDETFAKCFGEPVIAALAGSAMLLFGYDEGKYFIFGAVAMMANATFEQRYARQRIDDLNDGIIEGQVIANYRRRT
jgi:hypothetical protein